MPESINLNAQEMTDEEAFELLALVNGDLMNAIRGAVFYQKGAERAATAKLIIGATRHVYHKLSPEQPAQG
jgi:hypothetical protein